MILSMRLWSFCFLNPSNHSSVKQSSLSFENVFYKVVYMIHHELFYFQFSIPPFRA